MRTLGQASWVGSSVGKSISILGAVGISAIAVLGAPEVAKAAVDCGPGVDWVSDCEAGSDRFKKSWANIHIEWDLPALEQLLGMTPPPVFEEPTWIMLSGPVWVDREAGENGVIETTLFHELTGSDDFFGDITLGADGTGQIIQNPDGIGARSFFDVDFTIDAGGLSFFGDTTVYGDRPLYGVSPDKLPNGEIGTNPGIGGFPPNFDCPSSDDIDAAIIYCNDGTSPLFATLPNGADILVGRITEEHIVHVPEPTTAIASVLLGLGGLFGLKRKQQS